MKVTIEIDSKSEIEKLSAFFKTFKINKVKVFLPMTMMNL